MLVLVAMAWADGPPVEPVATTVVVGEPLWVTVPPGSEELHVRAVDEAGRVAPDVRPDEGLEERVDLARYAWLDHPGPWTITVEVAGEPSSFELELLPVPKKGLSPRVDRLLAGASVASLGQDVFVPELRKRALAGSQRAVEALGWCRTLSASDALVDVLVARPEIEEPVATQLHARLEIPGAWSEELDAALLDWARARLDGGVDARGSRETFVRLAEPADRDRLRVALTRAWSEGRGPDATSWARAMLRLPDADQGLEGEVAALVRLTGPGPYDPAVVRQGLASRDVTLLRAAIRALPEEADADLIRAASRSLGPGFGSSRPSTRGWFAERPRGPVREVLEEELAAATADRKPALLGALAPWLPRDEAVEQALALVGPGPIDLELAEVFWSALDTSVCDLVDSPPRSGGELAGAWREVLERRRSELRAGPLLVVPDTDPRLLPTARACRPAISGAAQSP
ncbi:MAG: hypothetical protein KC621_27640 [Myxococcales bacterium]|nr:hypothetical protein [Myxococcales bacterium]